MLLSSRPISFFVALMLSLSTFPSVASADPSNSNGADSGSGSSLSTSTAEPFDSSSVDQESQDQTDDQPDSLTTSNEGVSPSGGMSASYAGGNTGYSSLEEKYAEPSDDSTQTDELSSTNVDYSGLYSLGTTLSPHSTLDIFDASTMDSANVQIFQSNFTPAQRYSFVKQEDGYYSITNVNSGKALDVKGAIAESGNNVQQFTPNGTDAQKWSLAQNEDGTYTLVSKLKSSNGKQLVLDVSGGSSLNGTNVQIFESNGTAAQKWHLCKIETPLAPGFYTFTNVNSNKVLDVSNGSLRNFANVQQFSPNGTLAQRFSLEYDASDGYYTLIMGSCGKVLDVNNASCVSGANVQQFESNDTYAQKWAVVMNADGTYTFYSACSGLALDVYNASMNDGANIQVYESNGTAAQKFYAEGVDYSVPSGVYTINSANETDLVFGVSGESTLTGAAIDLEYASGSAFQKYYISQYGSTGYYTMRNVATGRIIGIAAGEAFSGANVDQGTAGPNDSQLWKPTWHRGGIEWTSKTGLVLDSSQGESGIQVSYASGSYTQDFALNPTLSPAIEDGIYTIASSLNVDQVMDVTNGSSEEGTPLQLFQNNGTGAQKFMLSSAGNGQYTLMCLGSDKYLTAQTGRYNANGSTALVQASYTGDHNQLWSISYTADGYFSISPLSFAYGCIDADNAQSANGTSLGVFQANGTLAQKYVLQKSTYEAPSNTTIYYAMNMTLAEQAGYQLTDYHSYDEYYAALDPNDSGSLYRFADIREYTGMSENSLDSFISSTIPGRAGTLKDTGKIWLDAAKRNGLNEVYLLSHAILESGWGTSTLATGYHYEGGWIDGEYYPEGTYYNFFGIGAYDDSPLSGGRKLAIINGWNSVEAAIEGGAEWIARYYVYPSDGYDQPSLYEMRFDLARSNAFMQRGWHQYCTSLTWVNSIATLMGQCYSNAGISPSLSYRIPQYV